MKAFITGSTGFVGSHLIDYLLAKKDVEIFALVRDQNNLKWLKGYDINFVEGDLFNIPSLPSDIDVVFHIAGLTLTSNLADYYTVNQLGTASLFQTLVSQNLHPKKILCLSSLAASGPSLDCQPVKELSPARPITPYGQSKLKGEKEALKYKDDFPLVILRATALFGPRDRDFLAYFKFIKRGILPSIRSRKRHLSLCYIKDLVRALDLAAHKDLKSGEIINVADPQPYSWDEFGETSGEVLGKVLKRVSLPLSVISVGGFIGSFFGRLTGKPMLLNRYRVKDIKERCWVADIQKAAQMLSFTPHFSLKRAVQETIDWYLEKKWL